MTSVVVPAESLPDAFGTPLRLGEEVTVAWWNVHYVPFLLAAKVTKLRTIQGRPSIVVDPLEETESMLGGGLARPGRILNCRPPLVVAHTSTGAGEGSALAHRDAHGRALAAGDRVGFVFSGEHRLYAWARGTVEAEKGDHLVVVPDATWQLKGYAQRVTPGVRYSWSPKMLVRLPS